MTKVDERSPPIELTEEKLERLARALDREGVVAASLFGSQATGQAGPLSDVDVGVWMNPEVKRGSTLDEHQVLWRAAAEALGTSEVDLVVLNDASPLVRHRAIRSQRILVDRDPRQRVHLEARAIVEYLDTKPLREELARGLRRALAEDRFGRRRQR